MILWSNIIDKLGSTNVTWANHTILYHYVNTFQYLNVILLNFYYPSHHHGVQILCDLDFEIYYIIRLKMVRV